MDHLFDQVTIQLAGVMSELEALREKVPAAAAKTWEIQTMLKAAQDSYQIAVKSHFEFQQKWAGIEAAKVLL